jgi:hypothetical protein
LRVESGRKNLGGRIKGDCYLESSEAFEDAGARLGRVLRLGGQLIDRHRVVRRFRLGEYDELGRRSDLGGTWRFFEHYRCGIFHGLTSEGRFEGHGAKILLLWSTARFEKHLLNLNLGKPTAPVLSTIITGGYPSILYKDWVS